MDPRAARHTRCVPARRRAGRKHGFANSGNTLLRIESTLTARVFETAYEDTRETPRCWLRGSTTIVMPGRRVRPFWV